MPSQISVETGELHHAGGSVALVCRTFVGRRAGLAQGLLLLTDLLLVAVVTFGAVVAVGAGATGTGHRRALALVAERSGHAALVLAGTAQGDHRLAGLVAVDAIVGVTSGVARRRRAARTARARYRRRGLGAGLGATLAELAARLHDALAVLGVDSRSRSPRGRWPEQRTLRPRCRSRPPEACPSGCGCRARRCRRNHCRWWRRSSLPRRICLPPPRRRGCSAGPA